MKHFRRKYQHCCFSCEREVLRLAFEELPAPVSPTIACRPLALKKAATRENASLMLSVVQSAWVPELSTSRYLWMSSISPSVEPSGLVTLMRAAFDPLLTDVAALVKLLPGSKIICVDAPAFRIAVTAS